MDVTYDILQRKSTTRYRCERDGLCKTPRCPPPPRISFCNVYSFARATSYYTVMRTNTF